MNHHHYERNSNQPGMISSAEIHLIPTWTLKALETTVGYSLHKIATLLPGQKRSQLSILEIWSDLMSSVLQFAFQTNSLESTKWHCCKIIDELGLHGLSCTKNVCRFPRYSAINSIFSKHHWLALILEPVGLTGDRPDGLTSGPCYRGRITLNGGPAGQLVLSQRPKPRLGCNSFWHFYLGPLQRQCYC